MNAQLGVEPLVEVPPSAPTASPVASLIPAPRSSRPVESRHTRFFERLPVTSRISQTFAGLAAGAEGVAGTVAAWAARKSNNIRDSESKGNGFEVRCDTKKNHKIQWFPHTPQYRSEFRKAPKNQSLRRRGPTSARRIPRTALTSRDDQPVLVKMVRMVLRVA